jgi:glycosyltransferase involved in cell wall biosynthesis
MMPADPMPNLPKVAIVTRTRNRPSLLGRAIESVLAQSMTDWIHVIVNDGGDKAPVDALCEEYKEAYEGRLKVLHLEGVGMQTASNEAIQASKSTYVVIHDDDDAWHPDFLKETSGALEAHGPDSTYQGCIGKTVRILEEEQADGSFREVERQPYVPLNEISLSRVGYENPFPPIAFLYRRSVHKEIGLFDPQWDMVADLDFNFRFLQRYEIGVLDKVLAHYHWRTDSSSGVNANTVTSAKSRHARLLNELKNHYLRKVDSPGAATYALSFMISSFAVENQWMTSEVRERCLLLEKRLADLDDKATQLSTFNETSAQPRLDMIGDTLKAIAEEKSLLAKLQKFNSNELWPKLDRLVDKTHASMEGVEHLKEQGRELSKQQQAESNRLAQLMESQAEARESDRRACAAAIEELRKENQALADTASATARELKTLHGDIQSLQATVNSLREETESLRNQAARQWQFGPLRIQWKPGQGQEDQDNPSS